MRTFVVLFAALVGLIGGGCAGMESQSPRQTMVVPMTTSWVAGDALHADTGNGAVDFIRDDSVPAADIAATLRSPSLERLEAARVVADRVDGVLHLRVAWPGGRGPREGASFLIRSPEAFGVSANTGNGAISIAGHSGPFDLVTTNGSIDIDAWASSGRTDGVLRTSNGRITAAGVGREGPVQVSTSNGRVELVLVPEAEGPIGVQTANGAVDLTVGPAFRGDIHASTSNGKIRVNADKTISRMGNVRVAKIRMGGHEDSASSRIVTSNGSITIRR